MPFFFSLNLKRQGWGGGARQGAAARVFISVPGPAGWHPFQARAPASTSCRGPRSPRPETPAWTSLVHTRAHTHPRSFTKMMEITIPLCFSFFFFFFCTRQLKKKKKHPKKRKHKKKTPNNQTKKRFPVSFLTGQHVPPQRFFCLFVS